LVPCPALQEVRGTVVRDRDKGIIKVLATRPLVVCMVWAAWVLVGGIVEEEEEGIG
jgi:hypothetical protein